MAYRAGLWVLLGLACLVVAINGQSNEDYEYEDEPPAPSPSPTPQRGRPPPRTLITQTRPNKIPGAPTKPINKELPKEAEEVYEEEEKIETPVENAEPTSSTEAPKRTIKPIVRPFRSNDELLAALKRKRQQAQQTGSAVTKPTSTESVPVPASAPTPKKSNNLSGSRTRSRTNGKQSAENTTEQEVSTKPNKRFNNSRGRPVNPTQEDDLSVDQPVKPKFPRGPRRQ